MQLARTPADALQRLLDGVQMLLREHVALARAEIEADARSMSRRALAWAAGAPPLFAGYLILMFALGWLLALRVPQWAAFGAVAAANLCAGAAVIFAGLRRLRPARVPEA